MTEQPSENFEQLQGVVAANRLALNLRDKRREIIQQAASSKQAGSRANVQQS